ncbi:MAG: DUF3488 and transglutaminase-like domain-containing protein [Bifidobacteriaceae bacterium]|jgi:transglutaminase-like putative cysteine protease|nr:DUF3488 and transglutaminase-like domain-containing protein [Bifidobacteriaceae bacterium]
MKQRVTVMILVVTLFVTLLMPLSYLAAGGEWIGWYLGFGAMVFIIGMVGRGIGLSRRIVGLIQVAVLPLAQIVAFAGDVAWLWVIPNRAVVERFFDMGQELSRSFILEVAPLSPTDGLFALVAIGGGLVAWAFDWYTSVLKLPAATGLFVLAIMLVCVTFVRSGMPLASLALPLAAYLGLLAVSSPGARPRFVSGGLAAGAIVVGLGVASLPGLSVGGLFKGLTDNGGAGPTIRTQVLGDASSLVDVSRDLRRPGTFEVLRYATARTEPVYLRLTTLDEFDWSGWWRQDSDYYPAEPTEPGAQVWQLPGEIPSATGAAVPNSIAIEVRALESDWVALPYRPVMVWGSGGQWSADLADDTVRRDPGLRRGMTYAAESFSIPTAQAPTVLGFDGDEPLDPGISRYLALPDDLPAIIAETAERVTDGVTGGSVGGSAGGSAGSSAAAEAYAKANALTGYFRGGDFRYSLDVPEQYGEMEDQADVLALFLRDKTGYCVHFASTMAVMARQLGIPARVAIGYRPGNRIALGSNSGELVGLLGSNPDGVRLYSVRADQLHSWPELYIQGLGWTAFEPTVGVVTGTGTQPSSSSNPSGSPSASSTPGASPGTSASPGTPGVPGNRTVRGAMSLLKWAGLTAAILLAVALVPGLTRQIARRRRLSAGLAGTWEEIRLTMLDLGLALPDWRTPADVSAEVISLLMAAQAGADTPPRRPDAAPPGAGQPDAGQPGGDRSPLSARREATNQSGEEGRAVFATAIPAMRHLSEAVEKAVYARPTPAGDATAASQALNRAQVRPWGEAVIRGLILSQPSRVRTQAWWFPRSYRSRLRHRFTH